MVVGARGGKDTSEPVPNYQLNRYHRGLETEAAIIEPAWVCTRPVAYMLWLFSLGFLRNS